MMRELAIEAEIDRDWLLGILNSPGIDKRGAWWIEKFLEQVQRGWKLSPRQREVAQNIESEAVK